MADQSDIALAETQFFAGSNTDLFLNNVDAGDQFGNRMFNLNTRIHFDEIEFAVFIQKFKCACATIADFLAGVGTTFTDTVNQSAGNVRGRRFLDNLLMASLHRAVTFSEPDSIFMVIGEYLNFNVTRVFKEFFHVNLRIAESGARFGFCHRDGIQQGGFGMNDSHAPTATTASSLDNDRKSDFARCSDNLLWIIRQSAFRTGHAWNACLDHGLLGADFIAHYPDGLRAGTNENKTGFFDAFGEISVFRQETITRVNGLCIGHFSGTDDGRHVQIALSRRGGSDTNGFIGKLDVLCLAIRFRMDDNSFYAQFTAGTLDAQCNFTAIGDKDFFKHNVVAIVP